MYQKIKNNQSGAAAILMTILILSSILFVSIIVSDLVQNGIVAARTQVHSTKALFAAESGVEKALDEIWKTNFESEYSPNNCLRCEDDTADEEYFCFNTTTGKISDVDTGNGLDDDVCSDNCDSHANLSDIFELGDGISYQIKYECESETIAGSIVISTTTIFGIGDYAGVNRIIESSYNVISYP